MKIVISALLAVVLIIVSCDTVSQTNDVRLDQVNTFDRGSQKWRIQNLPHDDYISSSEDLLKLNNPMYGAVGGNPGGYLYHTDRSYGVWYFRAPDEFVKIVGDSYGKTLTFDLRQSAIDQQVKADDIVLVSSDIQLVYTISHNPGVNWTNYAVRLDTTAPWRTTSDSVFTKKEIQRVLTNLKKLFIRGEYRGGADTGGLDNVLIK